MTIMALRVAVAALLCSVAGQAQGTFEFHSNFWVNLHEFLRHEARQTDTPPPGEPDWRDAVEYYRRVILPLDELGQRAAAIGMRLSETRAGETPKGLEPDLATVLAKAAAVYRRGDWPEHERANRAWIAAVEPLLAKYGEGMRKEFAAAYEVTWPEAAIRTDVAAYAGRVGGYTTVDPAHITISSTDASYRGTAALEMLFHEASHTIDDKVNAALDAELKARGNLFRRRGFSHAILFYTAGEAVRRRIPGYEPYGIRNGVLESWPGGLAVLEKDWKPYLEGKIGLEEAVRRVVEDYGVNQ